MSVLCLWDLTDRRKFCRILRERGVLKVFVLVFVYVFVFVFFFVFVIMIMIGLMMRMGLFSWLAGARTMGELWRRCLGRPSSALAGYLRMSLLDNIIASKHYKTLQNITKHYKTLQNTTKHYKTLQNTTKHYKTLQNITKHYNNHQH